MIKILYLLAVVLFLQSCATQQFPINDDNVPTVPTYEGTNHFIFWGIGQTKVINPKDVCGTRKIRAIESHYSFLQGLLTILTYGIYSPRGYAIYCEVDQYTK